jgi:histone deacetylase complex subunit SAP30
MSSDSVPRGWDWNQGGKSGGRPRRSGSGGTQERVSAATSRAAAYAQVDLPLERKRATTAPKGEMDRPLGKRVVRPNLQRSDFGYEDRTARAGAAAKGGAVAKKQKTGGEEEQEMMAGGVAPGGEVPRPRGEKDARNLTVDFTKLDMATLKRYKRHYRLKTRQNVTKTELALAVSKHFASQTVDEADTISLFMYSARAGSLDLAAVARTRGAFSGER